MALYAGRSLAEEAKMYLSGLERKGRQPSTIKRYAYDLEGFFLWIRTDENRSWKSLTAEDLQAYLQFLKRDKQYSDRTIDRILTVLKRFFSHCLELHLVANDPAAALSVDHAEPDDFTEKDFISEAETQQLMASIPSLEGLSENQLGSRAFLADRNVAITSLLLHYGLTLAELVSLRMHHVHFEKRKLDVPSVSSISRTLSLRKNHMALIFSYYQNIPAAVRPQLYSPDPLFVSFDFRRNTYRWDYSADAPKALTEIAVQKMLRQEVSRAGLRKGISAQHLRRTCILRMIQRGEPLETIQAVSGFKSRLSLKKYLAFSAT